MTQSEAKSKEAKSTKDAKEKTPDKPESKAPKVQKSSATREKTPVKGKDGGRIEVGGGNVAVVCRFRPLNEKELKTA